MVFFCYEWHESVMNNLTRLIHGIDRLVNCTNRLIEGSIAIGFLRHVLLGICGTNLVYFGQPWRETCWPASHMGGFSDIIIGKICCLISPDLFLLFLN